MKMYIVIKLGTPDNLTPVITAHAALACYLKYETDKDMVDWVNGVFKKVICTATEKEFELLKNESRNIVLTESTVGDSEVCIAFCPRPKYSNKLKYLKMWSPQNN